METRASYVIVGAFVLSFFIAIVAAVVWLADLDIDEDTVHYDIFFEGSVSGLSVGNPVRYGGIPIGIVTDMRISEDRFGHIQVIIEVPASTPIREDAVARLEAQGITGVSFIQLHGGSEGANPLGPDEGQERAEIQSEASALQQVFESAPEIMQGLEELVGQATTMLNDENIANVGRTLDNIARFSDALSESSEGISVLINDGAAMVRRFESTATEAERLVSAFADRSEELANTSVNTISEAEALVQDMRKFTADLNALVADVSPILGEAERTVSGFADLTGDMRGEVTRLSGQLTDTLDGLNESIDTVEGSMTGLMSQAGQTIEITEGVLLEAENRIGTVSDAAEETLQSYNQLATTISPMVTSVANDATVAVQNFSAISGDLRQAATSIAAAADEAQLLINENRDPVTDFTQSGLYEFTQLLAEMRVLVGSLTRITNQIERDPAQFFFGDSQQGYEVQ